MTPIESYKNDLKLFIEDKNFWQASLLKQLEGLNHDQALFKPSPGRHCIWEIVRHISYWKHWALTYVKEGVALNAKEDNWASLPDPLSEDTWVIDTQKLKSLHEECKKVAHDIGDNLFTSSEENIIFFRQLLYHDCYHTGQIGLLRVIQGLKPVE